MAASGRVEREHEGRPARMVGTNVDITDRKLREQAERQRAEVERQLIGIVSNALKYSPPSTRVTVTTRLEQGAAVLEVHNAGEPIPPELLGLLFAPMQRGSRHADPAGRSVGLGLYIVEQLVRAHCGTLGVTSTAEAGTTFIVRLPRDTSAR